MLNFHNAASSALWILRYAQRAGLLRMTKFGRIETLHSTELPHRLRRVTRCSSEDSACCELYTLHSKGPFSSSQSHLAFLEGSACSELHTLISARVLVLDSLYQREQGRCLIYLTKNIKLFLHRVQRRNKHAEEGETEIRLKLRGLMNEINNTAGHFCPAVIVLRM